METKNEEKSVNLVIPNTVSSKMEAIVAMSIAIKNLSIALASTNVDVTISNNTITGSDAGISIKLDDKQQAIPQTVIN